MEGAHQKRITVWIIEDDSAYRDTIALLLDGSPGLTCSHGFASIEEALFTIRAYRRRLSSPADPDVLLLDVNLPGMDGLNGLRVLKENLPTTKIVMLTIRDDAGSIYKAFREGASGYLLKNATVNQIRTAIQEAQQGGILMPSPVARMVLRYFEDGETPDYGLTQREQEVLGEMTNGYSQKEIATRLFVSRHTVNTHIQHIYAKLHVRSGIEAVAKALREGLV